jgi:hypothetical protein
VGNRQTPPAAPRAGTPFYADYNALLANLPVRVPRDKGADLVTQYFFEVSARSLERWPLAWRRVNGRAHAETAELFQHAQRVLDKAPPTRAGRRVATTTAQYPTLPVIQGGRQAVEDVI